MKNLKTMLFLASAVIANAPSLYADDRVISEKTVTLPVQISTQTAVFTNAGYSDHLVKVLVPALAGVTLLDHRNEGEGAPCMATYETRNTNDLHPRWKRIEEVPVTIRLIRSANIEAPAGLPAVCHLYLTEDLTAKIGGFNFVHQRFLELPDRNPEDCK